MTFTTNRRKHTSGTTVIEFALLAVLVAISALGAVPGLGAQLLAIFTNVASNINAT